MGIPLRGLHLRPNEQAPDHGQALAERQRPGSEIAAGIHGWAGEFDAEGGMDETAEDGQAPRRRGVRAAG